MGAKGGDVRVLPGAVRGRDGTSCEGRKNSSTNNETSSGGLHQIGGGVKKEESITLSMRKGQTAKSVEGRGGNRGKNRQSRGLRTIVKI